LTGRLTRDPEMRALASGKHVTSFSVATNEYVGNGRERAEYHAVIAWERLADICAQYLGKGAMVAVEGRLQTRQWDDEAGKRHWKTEVVASAVEMLSGRRKKDYAADALAAQGAANETDSGSGAILDPGDPEADELEVAASGHLFRGGRRPPRRPPLPAGAGGHGPG
jgi:single-strand DNA-binding protein